MTRPAGANARGAGRTRRVRRPADHGAAAPEPDAKDGWAVRVGWFVLLWLASVASLGVVAFAIRAAIMP